MRMCVHDADDQADGHLIRVAIVWSCGRFGASPLTEVQTGGKVKERGVFPDAAAARLWKVKSNLHPTPSPMH